MEVAKINPAITKAFKVNIAEVQSMVEKYQELILIPEDESSYKICRKALTSCIRTRTGIDKRRKELNKKAQADIKDRKTAADRLTAIIEPAETHLTGLVKGEDGRIAAIEEEEKEAQRKINQARVDELFKVGCVMPFIEVSVLNDEEYTDLIQGKTQEFEAEQERIKEEAKARKEEEDRLAKQKADQDAEAARLAGIQAAQEAEQTAREAANKVREDEIAAKEKKVRDEQDRIAKVEADKKAAEEAKIQAKIDARELLERQAKEKADKEKRAAEEVARQEALKPDKKKLLEWLKTVSIAVDNCPAKLKDEGMFNKSLGLISELTELIRKLEEQIEAL